MKLFSTNVFGKITITDEDGSEVATFEATDAGRLAHGCFIGGFANLHPQATHAESTLYDLSAKQYVVGNLSDLVA